MRSSGAARRSNATVHGCCGCLRYRHVAMPLHTIAWLEFLGGVDASAATQLLISSHVGAPALAVCSVRLAGAK